MDRANRVGYPVGKCLTFSTTCSANPLRLFFAGPPWGRRPRKPARITRLRRTNSGRFSMKQDSPPELLQPHQYRDLLDHRIGLTDFVKTHFGMDHQIPLSKLGEISRTRLRASILRTGRSSWPSPARPPGRSFWAVRETTASKSKRLPIPGSGYCRRRPARPTAPGVRRFGTGLRSG